MVVVARFKDILSKNNPQNQEEVLLAPRMKKEPIFVCFAAGEVETPKRRKLTQTSLMTMFGSGTSSAGSSSFDSSSVADSDAP